jgi:hypothetical protein
MRSSNCRPAHSNAATPGRATCYRSSRSEKD